MKKSLILLTTLCLLQLNPGFAAGDHPTLPIGATAPDFKLKGVDNKMYSLASFKNADVLVIVFTCNHCPTAQAYEDRLIQLTKDFAAKKVSVVAIMPNDPKSIRLNELDYTDLSDSFEEMKIRSKQKNYNFPYLYDGDTQATAIAYGPVATPHVFIFDRNRKLQYQGRIDNMEKPTKTPTSLDTRAAINSLLAKEPVAQTSTKVFGCSIKWAEKSNWIETAKKEWAAQPVTLDTIDEAGIHDLVKNSSDKLRLINVWATWCGPCVAEFPEFININRMYGKRDFEFVSVSADEPIKKAKALKFLVEKQASNKNYIFNTDDKYKLIEAIDPKWQGALPYTIVVEPGGKIVYAKQGPVDVPALKKLLIENPLLGRYF